MRQRHERQNIALQCITLRSIGVLLLMVAFYYISYSLPLLYFRSSPTMYGVRRYPL